MPTAQFAHTDRPPDAEYVPAEQLVHTLAPTPEYVPDAQLAQLDDCDAPVDAEYVPAPQLAHADDLVELA